MDQQQQRKPVRVIPPANVPRQTVEWHENRGWTPDPRGRIAGRHTRHPQDYQT